MQKETDTVLCHKYCNGSVFYGKLDDEGKPSGYGCYRFPTGIEYQGQFKSGVFHGRGMLIHPTGFKLCGEYVDGKCINYELYFADGLEFTENDWKYCKGRDRRFWLEMVRGIPPVGKSFLSRSKPARPVPHGMYDAGEGFFDPVTGYIYDPYNGARIRYVCPQEQAYIVRNYRMNDEDFLEQERLKAASKFADISTDSQISDDDDGDEFISIDLQNLS